MLSNLKEKILSVSLFSTEGNATDAEECININAGAPILKHFQNHWEQIHELNEENAAEAEKIADSINRISQITNYSKKNIEFINHVLMNSNLVYNINNCLSSLKHLYETSESIENNLIKLENLIDEVNFEGKKIQDKLSLDQYKAKRDDSFEALKHILQEKHQKRVSEYEASKKVILEERQKVFHDAFKSDLEVYKNLGTIPVIDRVNNQNGALLEEIQLDFDQNELDHFFNESQSENDP